LRGLEAEAGGERPCVSKNERVLTEFKSKAVT